MGKSTSSYPKLSVDTAGNALVSHGGAITLIRTAEKTGMTTALSEALSSWRKPLAHHDTGKIPLDLAMPLAVDGDCLADIAALREQSAMFGPVASDATVSRLITALARRTGSIVCDQLRTRISTKKLHGHMPVATHLITTSMLSDH